MVTGSKQCPTLVSLLVKDDLSVVPYNCHSFRINGPTYLNILNSCDVILLHEHWLSESEINRFCFNGLNTNVVSGFYNSVFHGGPYKNCAIIHSQNLIVVIMQVTTFTDQFCAVKIDCHNSSCLPITIYLAMEY